MPHRELPTDLHGLTIAARVRELGLDSLLQRERRQGSALRLRRGVYIAAPRAEGQTARQRYRDRALAVGLQRRDPVFAGFTAAVLHGLPVLGAFPDEIFLLVEGSSGRRRNGVVEIPRRVPERVVRHGGCAMTSITDTLIEVARTMPLLNALVMTDAALARPRFGGRAPRCTLEQLAEAYDERLPFRSSRAVRAVLDRATSAADSPFETLSRVRIEELGFPTPQLQYPLLLPGWSQPVFLDFAWPDHGVWGEADGRGKYRGSSEDGARHAADVVLAEKRREDEIRLATGWRCARWQWSDAWHPERLDDILRRAGLSAFTAPSVRNRARFDH